MNANIITIDVLSAIQAQPGRIGDAPTGNKTALKADRKGESQSYNNNAVIDTSEGGKFANILKSRLKLDADSSENGENPVKTKKSGAKSKDGQVNALAGVQLFELNQSTADAKAILAKKTRSAAPTTTVDKGTRESAQAIIIKELTSAAGRGAIKEKQVTLDAKQGFQPKQTAELPEVLSNVNLGKNPGKTTKETARLTDSDTKKNVQPNNNVSAKPAESFNQQHRGINSESFGLNNHTLPVQSKAQIATSTAATLTGGSDSKQVVASMVSGGRPGTIEPTSSDRIKDKIISDKQKNTRQSADGLAADKFNEKLNIETIESTSVQNIVANSNSSNGIGQIVSANSSNNNQQVTTATNASVPDTASAIREQIYESIQTAIQQGSQKITIHLNPPELGRVSVKFSQQGGELTGLLEANNPQTRAEIQQSIPEIIRSLEQSGITVKQIDVALSDTPGRHGQESFRENSSQAQWEQFNNQSFQDTGWNQPSRDSFITPAHHTEKSEYSQESISSTNQSSPSDKLLDVLI